MAFAKASLVAKVRTILNDNPFLDACTEAMDTTETGLDVADTTIWSVGDVVEFQDDGELCLVTALASATSLTVQRNYLLSVTATAGTGTSHSSGALIAKSPAVRYSGIVEHISGTLNSLWPYVYREINQTLTPDSTKTYYEMDEGTTNATSMIELSSVTQLYGSSDSKVFYYGVNGAAYPAYLVFNLPTGLVASGVGLYLPYFKHPTNSIYVNAIGKIDDTVATSSYSYINAGVQADCVAYLAAARLILSTDAFRTIQEDVTMGDQAITPGARTRLSAYYEAKGLEYRRLWEEELRLTLPRMRKARKGVGRNR